MGSCYQDEKERTFPELGSIKLVFAGDSPHGEGAK